MGTFLLLWGAEIRRWILVAVVAGVPVIFVRFGIDPFNIPKLAWLIVGVSAAVALRGAEWLQGVELKPMLRLWKPAAAVAAPLVLAWSFSSQRAWGGLGEFGRFQGLVPYLLVLALGLLVAEAFREALPRLLWAVGAAAGVVAAYALVQVLQADPFAWHAFGAPTTAISTLGNSNFTGGFLGMAIPVLAGLSLYPHPRRRIARQVLVVVLGGWIMARSQGGYAGGIAGAAVTSGLLLARRWPRARYVGVGLAGLVAAGVIAAGFAGALKPGLPFIPSTVELRGEWWMSAIDMGISSPLVGHGPNAYALEGVSHRTTDDARLLGYDFTDDPHSVPLVMFANLGILGLAGFLFVASWLVARILTVGPDDVLAAALAGGLIAYLVQALVSIDEISLRVTFWALLGAFTAATSARERAEKQAPKGRRELKSARRKVQHQPLKGLGGVIAFGLVFVGAIVGATVVVIADARAGAARALYAAEDAAGGRSGFNDALALRADPYYSYLYGLDGARAATNDVGGELEDVREAFSYLDSFPDVRGLVGYARFLHAWADRAGSSLDEEAVQVYERALALDPLNPSIRAELAEVWIDLGEMERALEVLGPAIEVAGTSAYPDVWGELALARARSGDLDGARAAADVALALSADEPHALEAMQIVERDGG